MELLITERKTVRLRRRKKEEEEKLKAEGCFVESRIVALRYVEKI